VRREFFTDIGPVDLLCRDADGGAVAVEIKRIGDIDGVEAHLQELLAANCETLCDGLRLVRREFFTDIGPVDLLCRDADGGAVAVEIKRIGDIDGVEQLARYLERMDLDPMLKPVRGIFAAQQIKPQAKVLAAARGITCVEVDYDALRGIETNVLSLF
jgi:RecB family endonuclease NucS